MYYIYTHTYTHTHKYAYLLIQILAFISNKVKEVEFYMIDNQALQPSTQNVYITKQVGDRGQR